MRLSARNSILFASLALLAWGCTPAYQSRGLDPGTIALGDDFTDGTREIRAFPNGTPSSVSRYLNETLPCNDGRVESVQARLEKAGCTGFQLISGYGQDGEETLRLSPICPIPVLAEDRPFFIDLSLCMGECKTAELQFELGPYGCAFYGFRSMLNY